jgi:type IX secretion system PorP/SprF family membrane protein
MRKIFTTLLFLLGAIPVSAQQDPQFSQYMHNKLFMNPAYAGMRQALCFSTIGREQWSGFDGAPASGVFAADYTLQPWCGVGFNVMYDRLGFESNARYAFDYSFHVRDVADGTLAFGIEMGAFSKRVGPAGNQQWISTTNWMADNSIPPQIQKTIFDFGFGIWYERKNFWAGISTSHLNAKNIDDGTTSVNGNPHTLQYQMARHYFITGGYLFRPSASWKIKPSFLVKTDETITTFDLNMTALYNNRFWFGASYRYRDAVIPMIGFQLQGTQAGEDDRIGNGLKVGFAYDYTTSGLKDYNNGTFEIFLNYCIPVAFLLDDHGDTRIFDRP